MALESFKSSNVGVRIAVILSDQAQIARMEQKSREGRPAVEAIGKQIVDAVGKLGDDEKKLVGRWVKQVLAPRGWIPDRKGRVVNGQLFSRGTIYRRAGSGLSSGSSSSGAERLAAARAILAGFQQPAMTSQEMIEERRRAASVGE